MTIQKFKINFTDGISITYNLIDDAIVTTWAELISAQTIDSMCPINHYIGYASEELVTDRINRLYELADLINDSVPDRLITEYNDIIHWLESILINIWGESKHQSKSSTFRITLDFNKSGAILVPIPNDSYKLFYPLMNYGDLLLHYTHVGKNAHEMFVMKDYDCPKDQFVPQRNFTASVRMYFLDNFTPPESSGKLYDSWKKFYDEKGGYDYWGYEIDDPKIAFGYIKIGEIESKPETLEELNEFREKLSKASVIDWEIIKGA